MGTFYWPNYVYLAEPFEGEEALHNDILQAINDLSQIPEFRQLLHDHSEQYGQRLFIQASTFETGFSRATAGGIVINQNDALAEFMGLDDNFHEFSLEMLVLHEVLHKVDSFLFPPDATAGYAEQLERVASQKRQINATLKKYDLEPINASDTAEEGFWKGMRAEEIRVIEKVNAIRAEYFPDLALRDPTAHKAIDPDKVRMQQGEPGWVEAVNTSKSFTPQEDRFTATDIREFIQQSPEEELKRLMGKAFENSDMQYLLAFSDDTNQTASEIAENKDAFEYVFGEIVKDSPAAARQLIEAYKDSKKQASLEEEQRPETHASIQHANAESAQPNHAFSAPGMV